VWNFAHMAGFWELDAHRTAQVVPGDPRYAFPLDAVGNGPELLLNLALVRRPGPDAGQNQRPYPLGESQPHELLMTRGHRHPQRRRPVQPSSQRCQQGESPRAAPTAVRDESLSGRIASSILPVPLSPASRIAYKEARHGEATVARSRLFVTVLVVLAWSAPALANSRPRGSGTMCWKAVEAGTVDFALLDTLGAGHIAGAGDRTLT
jgi:hypothetical protein